MYKRSRFFKLIPVLMLTAFAAQASNVTGKWTGIIIIDDTSSGTKIETPVELRLEQKSGALSGKIGRENDPEQVEIRNAKIEGDRLTFEASSLETSSSMRFSLKVQGEQMHGDMKGAAAGTDIVAKVSFSRVK